jgi:hypothetical protein
VRQPALLLVLKLLNRLYCVRGGAPAALLLVCSGRLLMLLVSLLLLMDAACCLGFCPAVTLDAVEWVSDRQPSVAAPCCCCWAAGTAGAGCRLLSLPYSDVMPAAACGSVLLLLLPQQGIRLLALPNCSRDVLARPKTGGGLLVVAWIAI